MKIRNLSLNNYKKFTSEKTFSFCDTEGKVNELTLLVGNNGSGKTSVLQAIVALIAPLTRRKFMASNLEWSGYEYRFLHTGNMPLSIRATVEFNDIEESLTHAFAEKIYDFDIYAHSPSGEGEVNISFDCNKEMTVASGFGYQFFGHQYAKELGKIVDNKSELIEDVGNIYWYTEQRNLLVNKVMDAKYKNNPIKYVRSFLANSFNFHRAVKNGRVMKTNESDIYERFAKLYNSIFYDRCFVGSGPRYDLVEKKIVADFFISDGTRNYELSEMSAGEKAIFPILLDFAQYNINHSIIIIDEVELHLGAPLQQAFIRALPNLGHHNQFILTSHSDNVIEMFDQFKNQIIRLD